MPGRFEAWVRGFRVAFNGAVYRAYMGALAAVLGDSVETHARQAVKEGLPSLAGSARSLGLIGADVGIERGPSESDAEYGSRLSYAIDLNRLRGRPIGLLTALHYAGFPLARMVQQNGLAYVLTADPVLAHLPGMVALPSWCSREELADGNPAIPASTDGKAAIPALTIPWWTFDAGMDADGNQWCSRFAIILPASAGSDDDLGTAANLSRCRRVIAAWKPAKARCVSIHQVVSGHYWGEPGLEWDAVNSWGGSVNIYAGE